MAVRQLQPISFGDSSSSANRAMETLLKIILAEQKANEPEKLTPYQQAQLALKMQPSNIELKTVGSESNLIRFNPNTGEMESIDLTRQPKRLSPKEAKTFIHDELDAQFLGISGLHGISSIMNQETGSIDKGKLFEAVVESSKGFESITNPKLFQGILDSYVRGFDKKFNENARTKFDQYIKNQKTINDDILSHRKSLSIDSYDMSDEERDAINYRIEQLEAQKSMNQSLYQPFINTLDLRANLDTPSEKRLRSELQKSYDENEKSYQENTSLGAIASGQQEIIGDQELKIKELTAEIEKNKKLPITPAKPVIQGDTYNPKTTSTLYELNKKIPDMLKEFSDKFKHRTTIGRMMSSLSPDELQKSVNPDKLQESVLKTQEGQEMADYLVDQVESNPGQGSVLDIIKAIEGGYIDMFRPDVTDSSKERSMNNMHQQMSQEELKNFINYLQDRAYQEQAVQVNTDYQPRY